MEKTLNMPPYERFDLLKKGEKVLCKKCRKGLMQPIGDRARTNTFICPDCGSQLISHDGKSPLNDPNWKRP